MSSGVAGRISASLGLWVALACAGPPLPPEAPPSVSPVELSEDEPRAAEHVFVVLDASRTMYHSGTFPRAKALTQAFVDALPSRKQPAVSETYNVGSIGFGGHERVSLALSSFDREALRASIDRIDLLGEVDGRGGSTPFHHVLREMAHQLESRPGLAVIVVVSDGTFDKPDEALDIARELVRRRQGRLCFYAVQLGSEAEGLRMMASLAASSSRCGAMHRADTLVNGRALKRFTGAVMTGR